MKPACPLCRFIHTSADARVINRFGPGPMRYVAATAPTPVRETRAEAEADECAWRLRRPKTSTPAPAVGAADAPAGSAIPPVERSAGVEPELIEFPAATMETAARVKAWRDFLADVLFSLHVWQLDPDVRGGCEHVVTWLRRCRDELDSVLDRVGGAA